MPHSLKSDVHVMTMAHASTRDRRRRPGTGFTLIEMMIVVAIIGVLTAIAYPAYTKQVLRSKRSDASTVLLEAAQFMQRYYNANNSFKTTDEAQTALDNAKLNQAPKGDGAASHIISINVDQDARGYTLTAAPSGYTDSDCGNLTLTHAGFKDSENGETAACWK